MRRGPCFSMWHKKNGVRRSVAVWGFRKKFVRPLWSPTVLPGPCCLNWQGGRGCQRGRKFLPAELTILVGPSEQEFYRKEKRYAASGHPALFYLMKIRRIG